MNPFATLGRRCLLALVTCYLFLAPAAPAQRLLDNLQLGGASNQVKSGGTLTIMSGGNLTIASGGTFTFTSGTIVGTLAIANGGTNATSASAARTALGLAIGTDVQPYDADLTTYAGITPSANVQTLLGAADFAAVRTALGLTVGADVQAYDADLTIYAGITPSANVQTLLGAADFTAFRTSLSAMSNPMTTAQDIIVGGSSGTPGRLGVGSEGQVLKVVSGAIAYATDNAGTGASATTSTSTGTQNDFDFSGVTTLYLNNATALTLNGLLAGIDGQQLLIVSKGAGQVNLANEAGASTAANRIINQVSGTMSLAAGVGSALLSYDSTAARWRVILHEQGAPIDVAYSSGDFTGSGTITWTVDSGDLTRFSYLLRGRVLQVWAMVETSTVSGTGSELRIAIPGGLTPAKPINSPIFGGNNSTQYAGFANVAVSASTIKCYNNLAGSNWAAATNATSIYLAVAFQVN